MQFVLGQALTTMPGDRSKVILYKDSSSGLSGEALIAILALPCFFFFQWFSTLGFSLHFSVTAGRNGTNFGTCIHDHHPLILHWNEGQGHKVKVTMSRKLIFEDGGMWTRFNFNLSPGMVVSAWPSTKCMKRRLSHLTYFYIKWPSDLGLWALTYVFDECCVYWSCMGYMFWISLVWVSLSI